MSTEQNEKPKRTRKPRNTDAPKRTRKPRAAAATEEKPKRTRKKKEDAPKRTRIRKPSTASADRKILDALISNATPVELKVIRERLITGSNYALENNHTIPESITARDGVVIEKDEHIGALKYILNNVKH